MFECFYGFLLLEQHSVIVKSYLLSCPKAQRWRFSSTLGFQGQPPFVGRSSGSTQLLYQVALWTQRGQVDSLSSWVRLSGRVRRDHAGWGRSPPQCLLLPLSHPSFLTCLQSSVSFQHWVGWFTLLKSKKNKVAFFFPAGNTKPFYEKVHPYQPDSL